MDNAPRQPIIAGVDEAGRGPLAGAVYAAAVVLDPTHPLQGLADSKKLSAAKRATLRVQIQQHALDWCIASASVAEIDTLNILQATLLAMRRAVAGLLTIPQQILVDGNANPAKHDPRFVCHVSGDATFACISAASILAKTERDAAMLVLDSYYPQYGFAQHKGYPTAVHRQNIAAYGASIVHRHSFRLTKA